jgi:hypothetical protein
VGSCSGGAILNLKGIIMDDKTNNGKVFWSMKSEKDFIRRLGTGCFCMSGVIKADRLTLLCRYKKALSFRTWEEVDTIENNLPKLYAFVDSQIGIERMSEAV